MNLDPNADNPLINMLMEGMGWISHAKNFGVIVKHGDLEIIETSGIFSEVEELKT